MSVTSIEAACRRCTERFCLDELLVLRCGACPRCGCPLTEDWIRALLNAATRAEPTQQQLIVALRNVQASTGGSNPLPHHVVRALIEDDGWQAQLVEAEGLQAAAPRGRTTAAPGAPLGTTVSAAGRQPRTDAHRSSVARRLVRSIRPIKPNTQR